jgi:hypothetical protein
MKRESEAFGKCHSTSESSPVRTVVLRNCGPMRSVPQLPNFQASALMDCS